MFILAIVSVIAWLAMKITINFIVERKKRKEEQLEKNIEILKNRPKQLKWTNTKFDYLDV